MSEVGQLDIKPVEGEEATFMVASNGATYLVKPLEPFCSCRDFRFRKLPTGQECKHLKAVRAMLGIKPATPPSPLGIEPTDEAKEALVPLIRDDKVLSRYVYKVNDYTRPTKYGERTKPGWLGMTAEGITELGQLMADRLGVDFDMEEPKVWEDGKFYYCFVKVRVGNKSMFGYAEENKENEFAFRHVITHAIGKACRYLVPKWVQEEFCRAGQRLIEQRVRQKKEWLKAILTGTEEVELTHPTTGQPVQVRGLGLSPEQADGKVGLSLAKLEGMTIFQEDRIDDALQKAISLAGQAKPREKPGPANSGGSSQETEKPMRAGEVKPEHLSTLNDLFKLCNQLWGMQPRDVVKELGYASQNQVRESPWECWLKLKAVKEASQKPATGMPLDWEIEQFWKDCRHYGYQKLDVLRLLKLKDEREFMEWLKHGHDLDEAFDLVLKAKEAQGKLL